MPTCPGCHDQLATAKTPFGVVYHCATCKGRMVGLATLRRDRVTDDFRQALWQSARTAGVPGTRPCPSCAARMVEVSLPAEMSGLKLDVCKPCQCVWFDPSEYERLPHLPPPPPGKELSPEAKQALAAASLEGVRMDQQVKSEAGQVLSVLDLVGHLFFGHRHGF